MCSCCRRRRTKVEKYEEEEDGASELQRMESSMKRVEEGMQQLAKQVIESMQEFQLKSSQESKELLKDVGEFMKYMVSTMQENQNKIMQGFQQTKQGTETMMQDFHTKVSRQSQEHADIIYAKSGRMQQVADSVQDSQAKISQEFLQHSQHAQILGTKSDRMQADIVGIENHMKQLGETVQLVQARLEKPIDMQVSTSIVKQIDTTLVNENASLAQQIEYLEEKLQLSKELSRDDIQEELQRLFEEAQEARAETAQVKFYAQRAKAQHDNETLHRHNEIRNLHEKLARFQEHGEMKEKELECIKHELSAKDKKIEWQREQTNLAFLWLRQKDPENAPQYFPSSPQYAPSSGLCGMESESHSLQKEVNGMDVTLGRLTPIDDALQNNDNKIDTGRSNGSVESNDVVRTDMALGWLRDLKELSPNEAQEQMEHHQFHGSSDSMHDLLAQEMFGEVSNLRRPTDTEINAMAGRIAHMRGMTEEQENEVRCMLVDIASALFGGPQAGAGGPPAQPAPQLPDASTISPSQPPTTAPLPLIAMLAGGPVGPRPTAQQIEQMAKTVSQRCGQDQVVEAQNMLQLMTDVLYDPRYSTGTVAPVNGGLSALGMNRPSERALEAIAQRVIARSDGSDGRARKATIRHMLSVLTEVLFGSEPGARSSTSLVPPVWGAPQSPMGSQLQTARSSVRSAVSHSEGVREDVNQEVHGLLAELCSVLFAPETP